MTPLQPTQADTEAAEAYCAANRHLSSEDYFLAGVLAERAKRTWQPIETAPKDGTMVLACWAGSGIHPIVSRWLKNSERWTHPFNKPVNPPTHWMPLPEPPK